MVRYFMLAAILVSLSLGLAGSSGGENAQKIVVHLSKFERDPHAAILAVKVAKELQSQGAKVTHYLDLEGVQLVDVRRERDGLWRTPGPLPKHYDALLSAGGKVLVSAEDARLAGLGRGDLRGALRGVDGEGILAAPPGRRGRHRRLAAFAIDDLTAEEEEELLKYLAFLRSRAPS